ncbi:MAG: hypothetical protein H0W63_00270 [Gemmatimonadaceae bacterium]|nr:hypothetical protein [Gemmatimonadaceae bacterium]
MHRSRSHIATVVLTVVAAIAALHLTRPLPQMEQGPFAGFLTHTILPKAAPSATAFGESGEVKLKFALPGTTIAYPLDVHGDPAELSYAWIKLGETRLATYPKPLVGSNVVAPPGAGFYQLQLVRGNVRRPVGGLTLAVMVPFAEKEAGLLRGYRIGTYLAERVSGKTPPPDGFLEISPNDVDIPITKHLRVGDFLNHDDQKSWPRYAAVSPRLLDKLELVVAEIARWHGSNDSAKVAVDIDVHSGFRAPDHNRSVRRAATDSQHQYGDAADVAIDVNGDGKFTSVDASMVGLAVEIVELKHPDLVGGLGLYTSRHSGTYVHIDARGHRARWRG